MQSFSISGKGKARQHRSSNRWGHAFPDGLLDIEAKLAKCGLRLVAGVDEAGRGPVAGPVVASAVILHAGNIPDGIRDSKKLSEKQREHLYEQIKRSAISVGIGVVTAQAIDRVNILEATMWAMTEAVLSLAVQSECVIVDGNRIPDLPIPAVGLVSGDSRCVSVAAASIVAKVTRDRLMDRMDALYPRYRFRHNKGYCTRQHVEALRTYGPTRIHRFSFEPVFSILKGCM